MMMLMKVMVRIDYIMHCFVSRMRLSVMIDEMSMMATSVMIAIAKVMLVLGIRSTMSTMMVAMAL
jgi:hypothetical protein